MISINLIDNLIELKTILLHEFFSEVLDSSVVLYLFFEEFSNLALAVILKQLVCR